MRAGRMSTILLYLCFCLGLTAIPALGQLTATKTWAYNSITTTYTINYTLTYCCGCYPASVGCPGTPFAYTVQAYEDDLVWDDLLGTATGSVTCNLTKRCFVPGQQCCYGTASGTITTNTGADWGSDVRIKVTVGGVTVDVGCPHQASLMIADADYQGYFAGFGRSGGNTSLGTGRDIRAMSRGLDNISGLSVNSACLYFCMDSPALPDGMNNTPESVHVIDPSGRYTNSEIYKCGLGSITPSALNLNVTPEEHLSSPTSELYFVESGSESVIYYSALGETGTPDQVPYLAFDLGTRLSAVAIEDAGERGVWDNGDQLLYAVEGSAAIWQLAFGGSASILTYGGKTFDGMTDIELHGYNDDGTSWNGLMGDITALSASGRTTSTLVLPENQWPCAGCVPEPTTLALLVCGGLVLLKPCHAKEVHRS